MATDAETARTFVVSIARGATGFTGSLVVEEPDGATRAREVDGVECAEVATALALATALAIDPHAAPTQPTPPKPPEARVTEPVSEPIPVASVAPASWSWHAALGPTLESGISPVLALGGSVLIERHRDISASAVSAFGIELGWLESPTEVTGTASSSFRLVLARPLVCSFVVDLATWLRASPCLAAELGALTGTGADLPAPSRETRFWAAGDFLLRVRVQPTQAWFVELQGALVVPITRYKFWFRDPDTEIHRQPPFAALLGVRLGFRL